MSAAEGRRSRTAAVSNFVQALDQVAGLLKLDREEESCRHVNAANLTTGLLLGGWPRLTFVDLVLPESQTWGVRFAVEEIKIVLTHEEVAVESSVLDGISPVHRFVAVYGYGDVDWRTQGAEHRIAQADIEGLGTLAKGVVDDEDGNSLRRFVRGELQSAGGSFVVGTIAGCRVAGRVINAGCCSRRTGASYLQVNVYRRVRRFGGAGGARRKLNGIWPGRWSRRGRGPGRPAPVEGDVSSVGSQKSAPLDSVGGARSRVEDPPPRKVARRRRADRI